MDETKIELPAWLPWATTACLAALVACLGEFWIIEKTRSQLLKDENQLAEASLKGAQNQLEAERIVSRREIEEMRAAPAAGSVVILSVPKHGSPFELGLPWGAAVWDSKGTFGRIRLSGLPVLSDDRDYQLWIDSPAKQNQRGLVLRSALKDGAAEIDDHLASPVGPGCRIVLIDGKKGGYDTLEEAVANGSIVLASPPEAGKISK